MGRIRFTLNLHAPPVVPHITHPNCCIVRRGGNLPARVRRSRYFSAAPAALPAECGALKPTRALMSARARAQ